LYYVNDLLESLRLSTNYYIGNHLEGILWRFFKPDSIFPSLPIKLAGKNAFVEVEVINANLDYNILLGRTWFYAMKSVGSFVFRIIHFPHQGNIVTIDQLDYCTPDM